MYVFIMTSLNLLTEKKPFLIILFSVNFLYILKILTKLLWNVTISRMFLKPWGFNVCGVLPKDFPSRLIWLAKDMTIKTLIIINVKN